MLCFASRVSLSLALALTLGACAQFDSVIGGDDARYAVADYTPEEPERCFTDEGGDAARENGTCESRVDFVAERLE